MDNIKYIMVTNWNGHWDKFKSPVPGVQSTLFTHSLIKDKSLVNGPWERNVPTLFIKKNKNNDFEKAWRGTADNFTSDTYNGQAAVRFEVLLSEEVACPLDLQNHSIGWHLNTADLSLETIAEADILRPPFFSKMQNCSWDDFEQYCFYLLKSIGINDLHPIAREFQKGKADGFFDLPYLSVIYDATIDANFLTKKDQQIKNYISQLNAEKIHFEHKTYTIKDKPKQVWLITRGSKVTSIRTVDHIKIKEIPYTKLIDIYDMRLAAEIGTDELTDLLKDLK